MMKKSHPIFALCTAYPQLTLPIETGIRQSEEYRSVCLRGESPKRQPFFITDSRDTLEQVSTPAGPVTVLTLYEREDFEHAYMALGNRCEPLTIPSSTGAVTFFGLNNWDKIRNLTIPLSEADKKLYKDVLILLSAGPYSNVDGQKFGISEDAWLAKSVIIRKYHELTHYISRTRYPDNKNSIRDEILADLIGIMFAFGSYDTDMARTFLGIEGKEYRQGGRLQNYVPAGETLDSVICEADSYIRLFSSRISHKKFQSSFDALLLLEEERVGLDRED